MGLIARDGYSTIAVVILTAAIISYAASFGGHWTQWVVYVSMALLVGFIFYFFRDPERQVPEADDLVLSPADGKVVLIKQVQEPDYIGGEARQISIFLSPMDVHVNRIPCHGTVEYLEYHPGIYLMAFDHRSSELNERADFGVRHPSGVKVFFRQITGFLARRIVYHIGVGDAVQAGRRFGMMKFGSRMDILLPPHVELRVKEGDRTVAGETVLAAITQT